MAKKEILRISEDEMEEDLVWIGISCDEKDYRLAWAFNEFLGMHFIRQDDHRLFHAKHGAYQDFAWYLCQDMRELSFKLVSNRCELGYLLEEFKNIDFLLYFLPDENEPFDMTEFTNVLRTIPFIRGTYTLKLNNAKNRFRLP